MPLNSHSSSNTRVLTTSFCATFKLRASGFLLISFAIVAVLSGCSNYEQVAAVEDADSLNASLSREQVATTPQTDVALNNSNSNPKSNSEVYNKNKPTLSTLRRQYETKVKELSLANEPLPKPPAALFNAIYYQSGEDFLAAYVTPNPADKVKHPAIIWITGGESNTLGNFWEVDDITNDQTASPYRDAGIIMMFPTLRGGNGNSGYIEYNYGEVDDIIEAAQYLKTLPYVDAKRIYLGGHSTGGTLALLVSEVVSSRDPALFKGIVSFGATRATFHHQFDDDTEFMLRAPDLWTQDIKVPTLAIEGKQDPGNYEDLKLMCEHNQNPNLTCAYPKNYHHFSVLYPANKYLALQILNNEPLSLANSGL